MIRMTREQQQQHNRTLLLEAAERIFATRGVEGASLDDVALEAGLTKGAVYSNFQGKGELILEVIRYRQTSSQEAQEFREILARATNDYERLEAWCDAWILSARSGDRAGYARLLFNFIPYALRDEELTARFLEFITPGDVSAEASLIPGDSLFAQIPVEDQFRILTALDLGLAALTLFDPDNVKPELYKTTVLSLAHTLYDER
ncbi:MULTISPECIES: TetR/AcrR family transcriptional regulator [unclassified Corynebacterium]|uniref:TetR/AcrR family transcriptional regulator n=1 Tax=unclassified Corynebacterium TaxID=2624378 RepID=UPI0029C9F113|nr:MULTISPECIES: TetR family transcriptional regulator [unclassified Corynebacterium]WPF65675.1 TetR family transcriptional regulator [Corynebacterium sp. 22KM0430]WPF68171.1 TetR family transcriptional regulator [Corynebacterium sp. 21KM1197]